jgi:hypothetical protein
MRWALLLLASLVPSLAAAQEQPDAGTSETSDALPPSPYDENAPAPATEPAHTEPAPPNAAPARPAHPAPRHARVRRHRTPTPHWTEERTIGWAVVGASFGVAVLGGVLLAVGVDDINTIENAPDGTRWADVAAARDRAPILTATGALILGLGAAGLATGAGLLAYFGQEGTWLSVALLPGGLLMRGTF